jgi:hypothetical protein
MWNFESIRLSVPAVPANNGTATLFDSTKSFPGGMRVWGIGRMKLSFPSLSQASAAGGLIGYVSGDKGVTWNPCAFTATGSAAALPATVAADTGSDNSAYDIFVGAQDDVKVTFTAGSTAPSAATWARIVVSVDQGNVHSGS